MAGELGVGREGGGRFSGLEVESGVTAGDGVDGIVGGGVEEDLDEAGRER